MKKKTQVLLSLLWGLSAAGSRILYFYIRKQSVSDTYGYFANAMIRAGESKIPLNMGLAHAYTQNLSGLLRFTGNRIEAACVYQMVLQILWIILMAAGISLVFGRISGIVSASVMAAVPMVLQSMMRVSPENFYMLHLSLNMVLLGIFFRKAQDEKWKESILWQIYLLLTGFYLGVVCIWNYVGICLALAVIYLLVRKKKKAFMLLAGMAAGIFATLIRYTGLTGEAVLEQLKMWMLQLESFPGRCQELEAWLVFALFGAGLAGILSRYFIMAFRNKKPEKAAVCAEGIGTEGTQNTMEEKQDDYVITEDGRRVKLLDNPLPVPKKHVKKKMGFDFDDIEISESKLDFDVEISENDDFDI